MGTIFAGTPTGGFIDYSMTYSLPTSLGPTKCKGNATWQIPPRPGHVIDLVLLEEGPNAGRLFVYQGSPYVVGVLY